MSKRLTCFSASGGLFLILVTVFLFQALRQPGYLGESFVTMRPFNAAVLRSDFRRRVIKSCPGMATLGVMIETPAMITLQGTSQETNGLIRVITAGANSAEAESAAVQGARRLGEILHQSFGATNTVVGSAHSFPSSLFHEPSQLGFRKAAPVASFRAAGRVFFDHPGISIEPCGRWIRYYEWLGYPACYLSQAAGGGVFSGNFLRACLLDEDVAFQRPAGWTFVSRHGSPLPKGLEGVEAAAAELRSQFEKNSRAIPSSWRQEPFVSDSGAHGLCLSFSEQCPVPNPRHGGTTIMTQAVCDYILTNAHQRCVLLRHLTTSSSSSDKVRQMIQRTLRLEP